MDQVRNMLIDAIKPICGKTKDGRNLTNPKKDIEVLFSDFGESSVNLNVAVWMLVDKKVEFTAKVKEVIYNTLNKNKVTIPFPQRDVHIIK